MVLVDALLAFDHEGNKCNTMSFPDAEYIKPLQELWSRYWALCDDEQCEMVARKLSESVATGDSNDVYCREAFYLEVYRSPRLLTMAIEILIPLVGYSREALGSDLER